MIKRDRIKRRLKKLNFVSIFFFMMSLISVTFAWFAFTKVIDMQTSIDVKTWNIDIKDNDTILENNLVIKIDDFKPGMETYTKVLSLYNTGDLPAKISYEITYLRIFDNEVDLTDKELLEYELSQSYPFAFNFNLDSDYLDVSQHMNYTMTVSWPLDSLDGYDDSNWGNEAYLFKQNELEKQEQDSDYQIRNSIELKVKLKTEQYIEDMNAMDNNYKYGTSIFYNPNTSKKCAEISSECMEYYVISPKNMLNDKNVDVIKSISSVTEQSVYNNSINKIKTINILNIINNDIVNSKIVIDNVSSRIIGKVSEELVLKIANNNGYFIFDKDKFNFLSSNVCYWTDYEYGDYAFAVKNIDENSIKLYLENKNNICKNVEEISIVK